MARALVRYWAAAKHAAGVEEETFEVAATLADLVGNITQRHANSDLPRVLSRSSFLVDGAPAGTRDPHAIPLHDGVVVEVLPPFAGG